MFPVFPTPYLKATVNSCSKGVGAFGVFGDRPDSLDRSLWQGVASFVLFGLCSVFCLIDGISTSLEPPYGLHQFEERQKLYPAEI